jgi:hypothetical protein
LWGIGVIMSHTLVFDLEKVKRFASIGLTQHQCALALGCSARTVESRLAKDSEFADAWEEGKASGIGEVSNALFDKAIMGDVPAAKFFLAARANWSDKIDLTSGGNALEPVTFNIISNAND